MNLRPTPFAALAAVFLLGASIAEAAPVTWTIDQTVSKVSLGIPDQALNLNGTAATVRIRNQTGSSNTWNAGNSAFLQGTFNTDYVDGSSVQFLFGSDTISSLNSGNYRPNPAAFNAANTDSTNTAGQFQNASLAAGVYGARIRATVSFLTLDLGYLNLYNVLGQLGSTGVIPLTGVPLAVQTFNANGIDQYGIESATIAVDGISALLVGQVLPDTFTSFSNVIAGNNVLLGGPATITAPDPVNFPLLRKMTIPIAQSATTNLNGTPLTINTTGTIVAFATIPEPSTLMLAGIGLVSMAFCARRRMLKR